MHSQKEYHNENDFNEWQNLVLILIVARSYVELTILSFTHDTKTSSARTVTTTTTRHPPNTKEPAIRRSVSFIYFRFLVPLVLEAGVASTASPAGATGVFSAPFVAAEAAAVSVFLGDCERCQRMNE